MNKLNSVLWTLLLVGSIASCSKNDPPAPDNNVNFEASQQGFDASTAEVSIALKLSRAADKDVAIAVQLKDSGMAYTTHYTTVPAADNGVLNITIPAGATSASFKVKKADGLFLSGKEHIDFTIKSAAVPAIIGSSAALQLQFSPIVSAGATQFQLNGIAGAEAGSSAGNAVYVDMSNNKQEAVLRTSWDLGFYAGDVFRVIINNTIGANAVAVNKTDINSVSSADIDLAVTTLQFGSGTGNLAWMDDVSGDITKTVIGEVSATEANNKVYILNRANVGSYGSLYGGSADSLIKLKVIRNGNGYTLQYATINATTFKTINITKDNSYNFQYVSINSNAVVKAAPQKDKWDIVWSFTAYKTALNATDFVPYSYADFVKINSTGGTQVAQVLVTSSTYEAYTETNIATTTFSADANLIGSSWRSTGGGPTAPGTGAKTDRFYVIKDAAGNVYKLKFISMGVSDGGTRGKPVIEYALVKKA